MKKRLLSLLLALVMVLGLCSTAFAAEGVSNFKQVNTYTDGQFTDVPNGQWYAATVKRSYELGLMKGTGNGTTFSPNGNITIAETLALACRLHSTYYGNGTQFVQGSPWYQVYVDYAIANGIIAADDYASYTAKATRADFVTILAASMPASAFPAINNVEDWSIPDIDVVYYYNDEPDYDDLAVYNAAYLLYRAGVLTGSDSYGTFKPESNIMRSEVATIVVRMADPSQRKNFTLAEPPENTIENLQGVWRSADGLTELVFAGNHWTFARKENLDLGAGTSQVDYFFEQGVTGTALRQTLQYWEYLNSDGKVTDDFFATYLHDNLIYYAILGNVVKVSFNGTYFNYLYKSASAELTQEVRAVFGEENILPKESLTESAVTGLRFENAAINFSPENGAEGFYHTADIGATVFATIENKEYEISSSMLIWTSSNPSVAAKNSDFYESYFAVRSNGTTVITAEYNGKKASTNLTVTNCVPVNYISDRYVWDYDGYHVFAYSLKDKDYNRIARDCMVNLRIVNDNGETVFETTKYLYVWNSDFRQWTYQGEKMLLGSIYIYDEEITPGTVGTGKLYYQVSDNYYGNFFPFAEYSLEISDLPLKETTLELPELPQTINRYNYDKSVRHSCSITGATYEVDGTHMTIYLSGQKTYDEDGSNNSGECHIGWKLYDSEGYVVDSGTCYSSSVAEGEKFRNAEINIYNLDIGGAYRLVLTNVN